jgi:LacI family transcriptional regulator
MKTVRNMPGVALLVDTSSGWGRRLVHGVLSWAHTHGPWHIWIEPHGQAERLRLPAGWRGDGVIARVSNAAMAGHLRAAGAPVVNVSGIQLPGVPEFPRVTIDPEASADLAVGHFRGRGFSAFGYVGAFELPYVQDHYRAFAARLAREKMDCHVYRTRGRRPAGWQARMRDMMRWVTALPKPIAVYTWGSEVGRLVIDACLRADIAVPHEVAVLGGDDDELLSHASFPPQSGIVVPAEEVGRTAAELLARLMRGGAPPRAPLLLRSRQIRERASTDTLALSDPRLVQALRFLREHAGEPITVADILKAAPMARRTLELKFIKALGRTPAEELRSLRLARARTLLADSDLPMQEVAEACGFATYNYLSYLFKKATGYSPLAYRKAARLSPRTL